jgi:hypothetical protein
VFMRMRNALGPLYRDPQFACLFAYSGQPVETPAWLALVLIMRFAEDLSETGDDDTPHVITHVETTPDSASVRRSTIVCASGTRTTSRALSPSSPELAGGKGVE